MFEKKILIDDDFLLIGKKKILWSMIVGLRIQAGKGLEAISTNFPRVEIFLVGGKVVTVSNRNNFFVNIENSDSSKKITCSTAIDLIKSRATNAKPILKEWFEWRLLLPLALCEIVALSIGFMKKLPIDNLVFSVISAGIFGAIIGAYWERTERKKICNL